MPPNPRGNRMHWKSAVLRTIDDDVIVDLAASTPSPLSAALIEFYGGATNRIAVQYTAYPLRDVTYELNAISASTDPGRMPQISAGHAGCGRRCGVPRQKLA